MEPHSLLDRTSKNGRIEWPPDQIPKAKAIISDNHKEDPECYFRPHNNKELDVAVVREVRTPQTAKEAKVTTSPPPEAAPYFVGLGS
jgi:hypothetical protein